MENFSLNESLAKVQATLEIKNKRKYSCNGNDCAILTVDEGSYHCLG